ncbi:hypothetical protein BV20DRAFT_648315 [Pilatotrama ljubarskyi]|nr:hypothetical protein BV20DRAFT_648315 [Pilatotrama ljubarskyi]
MLCRRIYSDLPLTHNHEHQYAIFPSVLAGDHRGSGCVKLSLNRRLAQGADIPEGGITLLPLRGDYVCVLGYPSSTPCTPCPFYVAFAVRCQRRRRFSNIHPERYVLPHISVTSATVDVLRAPRSDVDSADSGQIAAFWTRLNYSQHHLGFSEAALAPSIAGKSRAYRALDYDSIVSCEPFTNDPSPRRETR